MAEDDEKEWFNYSALCVFKEATTAGSFRELEGMLQQWNNQKNDCKIRWNQTVIEATGYVLLNGETEFWLRRGVSSRWGYSDRPTFPDLLVARWPSFRDSVPPLDGGSFFSVLFCSSSSSSALFSPFLHFSLEFILLFNWFFLGAVLQFPALFREKVFSRFPHFLHFFSIEF